MPTLITQALSAVDIATYSQAQGALAALAAVITVYSLVRISAE